MMEATGGSDFSYKGGLKMFESIDVTGLNVTKLLDTADDLKKNGIITPDRVAFLKRIENELERRGWL